MKSRELERIGEGIGNTPLREVPTMARLLGVPRLFLKLESSNPSGVQKDRAALAIVRDAMVRRWPGLTLGSCGNLGVAVARLARRGGFETTVFVPSRYRSARIDEIEQCGAKIIRPHGGYEDAVLESSRYARETGLYDANPIGPGGDASMEAYERIAGEIKEELGEWPDSIWVSVGNGTTLAGIGRGVLKQSQGRHKRPRLSGAGSVGNTAAVRSFLDGAGGERDPGQIRERPENEPLLNWRSYHAKEALEVVQATEGTGHEVSDIELVEMAQLLAARERIRALPAACAAMVGLCRAIEDGRDRPGTHVVVLTG